jgi:hypothetical protein
MDMQTERNLQFWDKRYSDLLDQWKTAVSKICESGNNIGLANYSAPNEADGDELRFVAFGMRFFVRFDHDFERGTIEYGILRPSKIDGQFLRVTVMSVDFDHVGNVDPPFNAGPISEYDRTHLTILASRMHDFVKAACDGSEEDE